MTVERVSVTEAAAALIESLKARHGLLLFHQSGGCCDGSAPMCYAQGEFQQCTSCSVPSSHGTARRPKVD